MKGKKIIVPLLLAGVTATGVVANFQQQNIQVTAEDKASWNVIGEDMKVEGGFEIVDDKVYLPKVTTSSADGNYTYKVTKGSSNIEVKDPETTGGKYYFIAKHEGYYNVSIEAKTEDGVKTKVSNLSVWIESEDAVINLPTNSKYVIPAKVPASLAGCAQEVLSIPVPTVTIGNNEEATKIADLEANQQLSVRLITPKNSGGIKLTPDSTGSFYTVAKTDLKDTGTYTIVYEYRTGADEDTDGNLDKVVSRLESNFQVVSNYDLDDVKLTMSMLSSVPTSGCVNTKVSLPKIKVTETATSLDAINAYVKVTIKNLTTKETLPDDAFDYETYTFTPKTEGEYMVSYKASIDLFGKSTSEVTPDQEIKVRDTQSAKVMPTVDYTVENGVITKVDGVNISEETDDQGNIIKTKNEVAAEKLAENTLANSIPSAVKLGTVDGKKSVKVTIPALFATDNFDSYADITMERSYRAPNGAVVKIDKPVNESTEVTLSSVGTYEFRFKATDKAGNAAGYAEYEVVVYDTDKDMEAEETKVNLTVGIKTISDKDKVLKFSKPTVEDTYDKLISTKTFYKAVVNGVESTESFEITETNADGKYVIDVEELIKKHTTPEAGSNETLVLEAIKIYSEAYVDGSLVNTRKAFAENKVELAEDGSIIVRTALDANVIKVVNSKGDTEAPKILDIDWNSELFDANKSIVVSEDVKAINTQGYALNSSDEVITKEINGEDVKLAAFDQGNDIVKLPDFTFTDTFDDNLKIKLTITNQNGDVVSKVDNETITLKEINNEYVYKISGASFKLSNFGVYEVTYQATDIGGNIRIQKFGIRVNDKTAPTIVIDDQNAFDKDIEVGKKFEVPTGKLVKNGVTMKNTPTWEIYKVSKGAEYEIIGDTGFVPLSAGTFTFRYNAVDEFGNPATLENSLFTVTAKDTTAPKLKLFTDYYLNDVIETWTPDNDDSDYMTVLIPNAYAYDGIFEESGKLIDYGYGRDLDVTISVAGPSSTNPEVVAVDGRSDVMSFKAYKQGTYTVTYSVSDGVNTSKETKTISIGDCEKPEIILDEDKDLTTEVALGSEFNLDLSKIEFKDNKTTFDTDMLKKNLTITMTDPDGNSVTNKGTNGVNFICDMNKTGSYSLKFVLKDEVGNSYSKSYAINVPDEEVETETISPVLGTVLVVLSVVVLAGVVIYFVVSSKKKGGKKTRKTTSKK